MVETKDLSDKSCPRHKASTSELDVSSTVFLKNSFPTVLTCCVMKQKLCVGSMVLQLTPRVPKQQHRGSVHILAMKS